MCHSIFCFAVKNSSCEFCRILKEWFLSFFGAGGLGGDSHSVETKCEGTCWCRYEASDFVFVVCFGLNFMNVRELQREREREREREKTFLWRLGVEYDQKPGLAQHATTRLRSS